MKLELAAYIIFGCRNNRIFKLEIAVIFKRTQLFYCS